jgi:serine/threonine-protein kinase
VSHRRIHARRTADVSRSSEIPSDILESASRRLGLIALLMAGVIAANLLVFTVLPLIGGPVIGEPPGPVDIAVFAALLLSLAVFFLAYYEVIPSQRTLDFGLLFEVALAVIVGVVLKMVSEPVRVPQFGMSGICLILLLFPVIVPNTLGKVLVTSLVVASMDPLGAYLAALAGRTVPPPAQLFEAYYWNYVCAALALIPAYTLRGLGQEVGEARAMGSYRLVEPLGEGGMGEVWTAEHRLLARPAAIKLIKPDVVEASRKRGGPGPLERFRREAEATAALRSPHSIELYDFGVTDEGTFYLVMELLDGFDLNSMVDRFGPVPPERAIHFLLQACDSLAEAHANELIHRDIKPANVYSCRLGLKQDQVKLLDFGLVKTIGPVESGDATMTVEGIAVGTPAFIAPEMAEADPDVDGRADIYSLGCVAYWLLTGRLVFTGSPMQVMMDHVRKRPEPPSERTELAVPPDFERVIMHCLEKDRRDRPRTVGELADAITACDSAGLWTAERAREWWELNAPASLLKASAAERVMGGTTPAAEV